MLTWNVYVDTRDEIKLHNVFALSSRFIESLKKIKKTATFEEFSKEVKSAAMRAYWSKCEYEILLHPWPSGDYETKIDVYDQLSANWDQFIKYLWENKAEIKKL